jgi:hypothetical protein
MAKYRVKTLSFINNSLQAEGTIVEISGKMVPHDNLEAIEAGPKADTTAEDKLALKRQQFAAKGGDATDEVAFEKYLAEQIPGSLV